MSSRKYWVRRLEITERFEEVTRRRFYDFMGGGAKAAKARAAILAGRRAAIEQFDDISEDKALLDKVYFWRNNLPTLAYVKQILGENQ